MNITIHSKYGCPYCDKIKAVLDQRDMEYTVLTLEEDFTEAEFREEFGVDASFPRVVIDGNIIGGCRDTVEYLLHRDMF